MQTDAALKRRARRIAAKLTELYPVVRSPLAHDNPVQLLVATILSAQCTDARVNRYTPALFGRYPDAAAFAAAEQEELETYVRPLGFYRSKARHIIACCRQLVEKHGGQVPTTLAELTPLPGVGRKTANVVLGNAFDTPGVTVDTHVGRLSRRLGLSAFKNPVKVERDLMALVPRRQWSAFSLRLIFHGRRVCKSRRPRCGECTLARLCPRIGVNPDGQPA